MASPPDAVEDALVEAQRALAVVYQDRYPCSSRVQRGLREILNQRFRGSQHEFTDNFLRPTITLLERLKEDGFPLVKDGKVIVHLLAPSNRLEIGEMFFQVGHTTPGTLALKFAKYQGNSIILQPSTIEEREFHLAFTQQYIRQLQNEASRFGNQLMGVLLVSIATGQEEFATEKVEVKRIMPFSFRNGINNVEKSMDQSTDKNILSRIVGRQPKEHCLSTSGSKPAYYPTMAAARKYAPTLSAHEPVEHSLDASESNEWNSVIPQAARENPSTCGTGRPYSSGSSASNPAYPPVHHAVRDQATPLNAHQIKDHTLSTSGNTPVYSAAIAAVEGDTATPIASHNSLCASGSNPTYPPIVAAVKNDATTPVTERQPDGPSNGTTGSNPAYPPIVAAVKGDATTSVTWCQPDGPSNGTTESNPAYRPIEAAVKADATTLVTGHQPDVHSLGTGGSNPAYPSIHEAVKNDSPSHVSGHFSQSGISGSNPAYPSIHQAVREDPLAPVIGHYPSNSGGKNHAHPSIMAAIKQDATTPVSGNQPDGHSSGAGEGNPAYPPIHQAVREDAPILDTGQQRVLDEYTPGTSGNNPAYPPIHQAVKEDPPAETSHQPTFEEHSSCASGSNSRYPPAHQAVKDETTPPDTGHQQRKDHSIGAREYNPPYPLIHEAVKIDPHAPVTRIQSEGQFLDASGCHPPYSPVSQAASYETTRNVADRDPYKFLEDELCLF